MAEEMTIMEPSQGNKFYMCTVLIEGESDSGKPKKIKEVHIVDGTNLMHVEKKVTEQMSGTMFPWKIIKCVETNINFVY
jgi:hypothetical protein